MKWCDVYEQASNLLWDISNYTDDIYDDIVMKGVTTKEDNVTDLIDLCIKLNELLEKYNDYMEARGDE